MGLREILFGGNKEAAGKKYENDLIKAGAVQILETKSYELEGHLHSGFDESSAWQEINWPKQHSGLKPPKTLRVSASSTGIDVTLSHSSVQGTALRNLKDLYEGDFEKLTLLEKVTLASRIAERNSPEPASNPKA